MAALTGAVQEALLCLLCWDDEHGIVVRSLVPLSAWDSFYRQVADRANRFWDAHKAAPGEHTFDLIEEVIASAKDDESVYRRLFSSMEETRKGINAQYVLSQAQRFTRTQALKVGVTKAAQLLQAKDEDGAEAALLSALKTTATSFDPGIRLGDSAALDFLTEQVEAYPTGIKELDVRNYGPVRKEMNLFVAPPKRGKSWWLVHLGKHGLLGRAKVLHITLEMSETRVAQRYIQALLSISKRRGDFTRQVFEENELGQFIGMDTLDIPNRPALQDPTIHKVIRTGLKKLRGIGSLIIKQFPTGQLTVSDLNAYLELLESREKFIPDLLIIDYPDLMKVDSRYYRHDLGQVYKDLRGIAVERNVALAVASQANREGIKAKVVRDVHAAEDISKIATADVVITYNQTDAERELGLARLFIADGRNDEDRFTILIAQQYGLGQFCFESTRMISRYWSALKQESPGNSGDDDD